MADKESEPEDDFYAEFEAKVAAADRGPSFFIRYRKPLLIGIPVVLVLLLLMCSGSGVIEKRSAIYPDLAKKYSVFLVAQEGGVEELNMKSGKLQKASPTDAKVVQAMTVYRPQTPKSGVLRGSPDSRWVAIAKPVEQKLIRQFLVDNRTRTESLFGRNKSWKRVFWSPDSRYVFYLEQFENGIFGMIGQVLTGGLMAEDDMRPHVLIAMDPETKKECVLVEVPTDHYEVVINAK